MVCGRADCEGFWRSPGDRKAVPGERARGVAPYSVLAEFYDLLVGDSDFDQVWRAFSTSIRKFNIHFYSIADLGCGTGRFLAALPARGLEATGIDRSPAVLAVAARRLAGRRVRLLCQDLCRLKLPGTVDIAACQNQTVNYLTRTEDLARAFRAIAASLRRGGMFLFDFMARLDGSAPADDRISEIVRLPDQTLCFEALADRDQRGAIVRIELRRRQQQRLVEVHRLRWWPVGLVRRLLDGSGFEVLDIRPVLPASAWLHVVARLG